MGIPEKEIKKLWGLAAGRCSYPDCKIECVTFLDSNDPLILGEMAHVIAESPKGPRGIPKGGKNTYENLILLCPFHHEMIDKAPVGKFPAEILYDWKKKHELWVFDSLKSKTFATKEKLFLYISKLLAINYSIWKNFGPESEEAKRNPYSNLAMIWKYKKIDSVIPNNTRIKNAIQKNMDLLTTEEYKVATDFFAHADAFKLSNLSRTEGIPKFPIQFEEMIYGKKE